MTFEKIGAVLLGTWVAFAPTLGSATVRISEDHGGRIDQYQRRFAALRSSGERVVIDGLCSSACTLVLGAIPRQRICVTPRAVLGFHAAWVFGPSGGPVTSPFHTRLLWTSYPTSVRSWISRNGGLTPHMIYLQGHELTAMFAPCEGYRI